MSKAIGVELSVNEIRVSFFNENRQSGRLVSEWVNEMIHVQENQPSGCGCDVCDDKYHKKEIKLCLNN